MSSATTLITPADRVFVAGHRGMAGGAIVRALQRAGYGDGAQGGALLTAISRGGVHPSRVRACSARGACAALTA